jgi:hypothetical protein
MYEDSYEEYLIDSVLLVALMQCFRPGEHYLTTAQLFQRGLAPLESYCEYCVDRLVIRGLVVSTFPTAISGSDRIAASHNIGLVIDQSQMPDEPVRRRLDSIVNAFSQTIDCLKHLLKLEREIQVCECIEVGDFYANMWGMKFQNISFSHPKLALIVQEKNVEITQTLILRTLKRAAKDLRHSHMKPLDFPSFMNAVYELYLRCKRRGIYINGQPRPAQLKRSILAEMLDGYLSDAT